MMTLDLRTIIVMLVISAVLMTLLLAFGLRAGRTAGIGKWNLGLGLYALGWLLVAGRSGLPAIVGIALADALLLAGLCVQLGALIEFGGSAAPRWLLIAPPLALFAFLLPIMDRFALLTLTLSFCFAVLLAWAGGYVLRLGRRAGPVRWLMAPIYFSCAAAVLMRAGYIALDSEARSGLFAGGNAVDALAFLMLFAATVSSSFGFLIMQRERAERALHTLAMHDALTGLLNRRSFAELGERELARARRTGAAIAALMLDIDHFKHVNDTFGHPAGDRVLADLAAGLKRWLRAGDLVSRYGGEEFCLMLPSTGAADALAVAERIRAGVAASPMGALPTAVTVSIGVAAFNGLHAVDLAAIIACADEALYQAKRDGRNRVVMIGAAASAALSADALAALAVRA